MMDDLPDRPAALAIRRIELCFVQPLHRGAYLGWCGRNLIDGLLAPRGCDLRGHCEISYGVARIHLTLLGQPSFFAIYAGLCASVNAQQCELVLQFGPRARPEMAGGECYNTAPLYPAATVLN